MSLCKDPCLLENPSYHGELKLSPGVHNRGTIDPRTAVSLLLAKGVSLPFLIAFGNDN